MCVIASSSMLLAVSYAQQTNTYASGIIPVAPVHACTWCACSYQLNPLYVLITVIAYMMKDRMKEWGKRYLEPVCIKLGFEFPDRIVKVSLEPCLHNPPLCRICGRFVYAHAFAAQLWLAPASVWPHKACKQFRCSKNSLHTGCWCTSAVLLINNCYNVKAAPT